MIELPYESRDEWLHERTRGIGGSDIAAILGMSPFASPYTVWLEKTGRGHDIEDTEPMLWGRLLESSIAAEFERRTGLAVHSRNMLFAQDEDPTVRATVDGLVSESPDGDPLGVLEVKTTGIARWTEPPDHYQLQCQWNMFATGLDACWLVALFGGRHMAVYELNADVALQAELYAAAKDFWTHVESDTPPPIDGSEATADALRHQYPGGDMEPAQVPQDLIARFRALDSQIKGLEGQRRQLRNQIEARMGDSEVGYTDGVETVSWRSHVVARIDTKRLKAEAPDVAERFTRHTTQRRFTVKGEQQ